MTALSIAMLGRGSAANDGTGDSARDGALKLNKNARLLEALAKGAVISATTTAQPVSPSVGDLYIIPSGKTGTDWSLMTNGSLALYAENGSVNAWFEITPSEGWRMHARDTDTLYRHDGSAWVVLISPALADVVKAASLTLGRAAFGLAIGTDVLAYSALVQALAASAPSAGDFWYAASATTVSKQASTSFGRGLLNLADASALRTSAALGTAATQNTGTSGANVPLLNGNNTHSGNNIFTGSLTRQGTYADIALLGSAGGQGFRFALDGGATQTLYWQATQNGFGSVVNVATINTSTGALAYTARPTFNGNTALDTNNGAALSGATFTGAVTLSQGGSLQFKSSGGSIYAVLFMYSDDHIYFDQQVTGKDIIFRGPSYTEVMRISGANRLQMATPIGLKSYTVAGLPAGSAADIAYASNGRKNGEGAGAGTGVLVFKDGTAWRACDTGATVAA